MIRRAEARDVPALLELVRGLAAFERAEGAVTVTEDAMRDAGFGECPVWIGWIAEENERPIGMAICFDRWSTWKGRVLFLEDLYVVPEARGRGLGEQLLRIVAEHARAHGYVGLRWQVLDWNEGAVRFYERFGATIDRGWWNVDLQLSG